MGYGRMQVTRISRLEDPQHYTHWKYQVSLEMEVRSSECMNKSTNNLSVLSKNHKIMADSSSYLLHAVSNNILQLLHLAYILIKNQIRGIVIFFIYFSLFILSK